MTIVDKNGCVEFRFFRPGAQDVALSGDFDKWSSAEPMTGDASGWWTLEMKLAPGEYRFRYVSDGTWYTDFASNGVEATKTGWNSILVIPKTAANPYAGEALKVA